MNKEEEKFLVNLYQREQGQNNTNCVADCVPDGDLNIIKNLDEQGYVVYKDMIAKNEKNQNVFEHYHTLTEKGHQYLYDKKLI